MSKVNIGDVVVIKNFAGQGIPPRWVVTEVNVGKCDYEYCDFGSCVELQPLGGPNPHHRINEDLSNLLVVTPVADRGLELDVL